MEIKEQIDMIIETRKTSKKDNADAYLASLGYDTSSIEEILLKDYAKTVEFLKNATKEEIAISVEALDALFVKFKSKEIVDIFDRKGKEYPDVDEYCEYDYFGEVSEYKECLLNDSSNK